MSAPVVNAMSVDVEDYFHVYAFMTTIPRAKWPEMPSRVAANTDRILQMFADAGIRATFFTLGCVARDHGALIRRIAAAGHEIASHGMDHYHVWEQDPPTFARDVADSRKLLEDVSGSPVLGYRAASFSINVRTWFAYEGLQAAGYRYSSSVNPIRHDHYGLPEAPRWPFRPAGFDLLEVPITTNEVAGRRLPAGGGGFFRLFPAALQDWHIARVNGRERQPAVFYTHPWEIDPGQPRIAGAPWKSRFRHYVNLAVMDAKLARLAKRHRWGRMDEIFLPGFATAPAWQPAGASALADA